MKIKGRVFIFCSLFWTATQPIPYSDMILCIHFSKVSAVNYQKTDKSPRLPMLFVCFCTSQTLSWCSFAVETAIYRTLLMLKCWAKMWFLWIALVLMKWWGLKNARKYTHQPLFKYKCSTALWPNITAAFKHVNMVKMTCWSTHWASEYRRKLL